MTTAFFSTVDDIAVFVRLGGCNVRRRMARKKRKRGDYLNREVVARRDPLL